MRIEHITNKIIAMIFVFILGWILSLVIFVDKNVNYNCTLQVVLPNWIIIINVIFACISLMMIFKRYKNRPCLLFVSGRKKLFVIANVILLILEVIISSNIYFKTGWDCEIITSAAQLVAAGGSLENINYFMVYPNNISWTFFLSVVFKISNVLSLEDPYFLLVLVNCILVNMTGVFLYLVCCKITDSYFISFLTWGLFAVFLGVSPWIVIPYTDTAAMLISIFVLFIYTGGQEVSSIKWMSICFLCMFGASIKPTVFILFISIIIIEICKNKKKIKEVIIKTMMIGISILLVNFSLTMIRSQMGIIPDSNKEMSYLHYIMMGLNDETTGVFSSEDVPYTLSFDSAEEKKEANIRVIKDRLQTFGPVNYLKFINKKCLVNYNDGTFAWGVEGDFFKGISYNSGGKVQRMLKEIYYPEGDKYSLYTYISQSIWLMILGGCFIEGILSLKRPSKERCVVFLSIIGITLFNLLFEARARYLLLYVPFFILLTGCCWNDAKQMVCKINKVSAEEGNK